MVGCNYNRTAQVGCTHLQFLFPSVKTTGRFIASVKDQCFSLAMSSVGTRAGKRVVSCCLMNSMHGQFPVITFRRLWYKIMFKWVFVFFINYLKYWLFHGPLCDHTLLCMSKIVTTLFLLAALRRTIFTKHKIQA